MNLLIVDDQPNVISSLLKRIPWQSLDIANVYTATSALAAREILTNKAVDILLTDIEMPQENGLSLIQWLRGTEKDVECILLTSHANFFYAQSAISLGVADYVIQPASNADIIQAVEKAKLRLLQKRKITEQLRINEFLSSAQNTVIREYFENLSDDMQKNAEIAKQLGILGFHEEEKQLIVLCTKLNRWIKLPPPFPEFFSEFKISLQNTFSFLDCIIISYYSDESTIRTILFTEIFQDFEAYLKHLQKEILENSGCFVGFFYSESSLEKIPSAFKTIDYWTEREEGAAGDVHQILEKNDFERLSPSRSYEKYVAQLRDYIRENLSSPLTRDSLAQALAFSPDHLSYLVRFSTGESLKTLITKERMHRARELLRTTDMSIGEIATYCGYESSAYFSKVYRDTYQTAPRDERK